MGGRDLLPGEYAVLGLLALRPMHGYEMARYFDQGELGTVCPLEQSLLYTYLRNVEERALVEWDEVRVGLRPPRKRYHLAEAGRAALDLWLREPVPRIRQIRSDFLLKLYFLHDLDRAAAERLVEDQVQVCARYRARLAASVEAADGFERLVALSRLSAAEATLTWLRESALDWSRA
jgi:PadR family transcriptional regulator AphA